MKLKRKIIAAALAASTMLLCSANAFAGVNFGNGDGSDFKHGTEDNGWLLKKDNGSNIYDGPYADLEALRLTVYEAETQTKVYRTLDVTGESSISSISNIMHFADGTELIPKTTWLSSSYVGTTYNAVDAVSVGKFQRATIDSSRIQGSGYTAEYVVGLSDIDIVSANNTSNYEAIKAYIGDEQFIKNVICHFIPELEYDDFVDGKYKIAFEPVAYFRYDGMNWALSATECGILNHYDKVTYSAAWNSTCNMRSLMGPLTHSNLPRSAFLVEPDLGVSVYAPTESDYYSSYHINSSTGLDDHDKYNSDICIIRCMGIGTLGNDPPDNDEEEIIEKIMSKRRKGKKHHIIVNAEGIGHSHELAKMIEERTGIETRATVIGHIQRGGNPSCRDRVYASAMGALAVDILIEGKTNRVVAYKNGKFCDYDIDEALNMTKDIDEHLYSMTRRLSR